MHELHADIRLTSMIIKDRYTQYISKFKISNLKMFMHYILIVVFEYMYFYKARG